MSLLSSDKKDNHLEGGTKSLVSTLLNVTDTTVCSSAAKTKGANADQSVVICKSENYMKKIVRAH